MLKVYLDHNVYQDLKKEENKQLLDKIHAAKKHIIFCFSEAHLYDLNQDKTDEKFVDMDFIGSIAENHCYVFTDRTQFVDRTPRQYYDDFDWSYTFNIYDTSDPWLEMMIGLFKAIPLDFQWVLKNSELPSDMPTALKKLLFEPVTMYDFMATMLELTDKLTNTQKEFKQLIQYLHQNSLLSGIYQSMGINGFDGIKITDRASFYGSYVKQFIREGQSKSRLDLYSDMYHGLEFYGFVKGKPRKQKMMNLINDAKHSFFGSVWEVIISKDADFLEKTRFMYEVEGIVTKVLPASALNTFLDEQARQSDLSIGSLFSELAEPLEEDRIIGIGEEKGSQRVFVQLKNCYYSYFNLFSLISDQYGTYWSIYRKFINYNNTPFKLQIKHIVGRLIIELGKDINQKGEFTFSEQLNDKSEIRCWVLEDIVISLVLDEILYLNIYKLDYLKKKWQEIDSVVA